MGSADPREREKAGQIATGFAIRREWESCVQKLGALERRAEGQFRDESVLHVNADAVLVHPARVRLRVVLESTNSRQFPSIHFRGDRTGRICQHV